MGKNIAQIDLDKGLWTAQSPALLAMGLLVYASREVRLGAARSAA